MTHLNKMKWMKRFGVLLLIFPLTGCWGYNEVENMVYAYGLGLDYKDGKYTTYVQILNFSLLAKSASGGASQEPVQEIGHGTGDSIQDAISNLYNTVQRKIYWGHISYVVLSKDLINQDGFKSELDFLNRFYQSNYNIWLFISNDSVLDTLNTLPNLGFSPNLSRLGNPTSTFEQYSFIPPINVREFNIFNDEPPFEIFIPLIKANSNNWQTNKPSNSAALDGLAVITKDQLNGTLTNNQLKGFKWINKDFSRTELVIKKDRHTDVLAVTNKRVKITPINNSNLQFDISIVADATVNTMSKKTSINGLSNQAEALIRQEVLDTYLNGLKIHSDLYRLSNVLYKKDYLIWKKHEINGKIPLGAQSIRKITVKLNIKDTGKLREIPALSR